MKNDRGFTLIEIMIVVMIIGILLAAALPMFQKAKRMSSVKACAKNMQMIDSAKNQWVMENGMAGTATPATTDLNDYLRCSAFPTCPEGADPYELTNADTKTACPNVGSFAEHVQQ